MRGLLGGVGRRRSILDAFGAYSVLRGPTIDGVVGPRPVPSHIQRPPYIGRPGGHPLDDATYSIKSRDEIEGMRAAGALARETLAHVRKHCQVGMTSLELDAIAHDFIVGRGAYPSPLGYRGFPRSICISVNNVIAHGIPDHRKFTASDIVHLDVTVYLDGFHGDTSACVIMDAVDEKGRALVEASVQARDAGIKVCGPGVPISRIGSVIEHFAKQAGYAVVGDLAGHGIGRGFHEPPSIYHVRSDDAQSRTKLLPGMTLTVEPTLVQGVPKLGMWVDGWTLTTRDFGRGATCEHTILITEDGHEILT